MIRLVSALVLSMALLACVAKEGESERVGSSGAALTPTPIGPNTVPGIDVSLFQGSIDWTAQRAAGRMFGIARVGDGDYEDTFFDQNWADMKAAGVIRGAYQYFRAGTDPNLQADIMIKHVGKLGDGDLPCTIDIETLDGASSATLVAGAQAWVAKVEAATGRRPIIYTGPYFWQDNVGSDAFAAYPLWIAHYDVAQPSLPAPWTTFEIWQYSDSSGTLDLDYFNGSLAELTAFASSGSSGSSGSSPTGYLDVADCAAGIGGWAQDTAAPTQAIDVHLSFDGAEGAPGASVLPVNASLSRPDLCVPLGSCNHAFSVPVPSNLRDSKPHQVFAYGVNSAKGANALLTNAPRSFTCAPADPSARPADATSPAAATASSPGAAADGSANGSSAGCHASPSSPSSPSPRGGAGSFTLASLVVAALVASRRRRTA